MTRPWQVTKPLEQSNHPYTVVSILASAKLADRLPIGKLLESAPFAQLTEVLDQPRLAFLIGPQKRHITLFQNGTATVRGCKSVEEAEALLMEAKNLLSSVIPLPNRPMKAVVQNVVATHDLLRPIELSLLNQKLPALDISYEPEQFPGLILRLPNERTVVLIFSSGKVVITGTRSIAQLEQVLSKIHQLLDEAGT